MFFIFSGKVLINLFNIYIHFLDLFKYKYKWESVKCSSGFQRFFYCFNWTRVRFKCVLPTLCLATMGEINQGGRLVPTLWDRSRWPSGSFEIFEVSQEKLGFTQFYPILHDLTQFYPILPDFTQFFPDFPGFSPTYPDFSQLYLLIFFT